MPAVLWPAGPAVRVAHFERREAEGYFDAPYLVYLLEVVLFDSLEEDESCPFYQILKIWICSRCLH